MKQDVVMPSLGADMREGKIIEWKIHEGDFVTKKSLIALVETTKSILEIESMFSGKVLKLLSKVGDVIPVGEIIATFDVPSAEVIQNHKINLPPKEVTPRARKLIQDHHLDFHHLIKTLPGSGPAGRIEAQDVENLISPDSFKRKAISLAMSQSKKNIPHYYLKKRVHLTHYMSWLDETNNRLNQERITLFSGILKSISLALLRWPNLNGYFINDQFKKVDEIHLGIALGETSKEVIAPSILNTERLSLSVLNSHLMHLLERSKKVQFKSEEMANKTITVSHLGTVDEVFGIIFPPEVATIGIGKVYRDLYLHDDHIEKGFFINITLSADHRVTDGLYGANFLNEIERFLMNPNRLAEVYHDQ